ncbi:CvpA family protein [Desulfolucanica intricata]|uniref:CvpA family protein n=1 Tax=Desulfolucanica intricata TaxID=1285191 RepID=UPI0008304997|nr:CvpA family protein [Desulfolucanica intricata]
MNWLDIIILAIFILSGIKGFFTGMILSFTRLISIMAGLLVANQYSRPLADYLSEHWHWVERISVWISARLQNLELLLFDSVKTPVTGEISSTLAINLLQIIVFLFLLLVTARIVQLIGTIISGLAAFTLLGPLDRIGGVVFGLIRGLLIIVVFLVLLTPLQSFTEITGDSGKLGYIWLNAWDSSRLVPYFKGLSDFIIDFFPGIPLPKSNQLIEI